MSSTEGMIDGGSSSAQHKALAPGDGNGGFVPSNKMTVEPPKKEDLQRKYATVVEHEAGPNDWYGSMSEYYLGTWYKTAN
jgi:erythrocyte band 7 integral membrane protein